MLKQLFSFGAASALAFAVAANTWAQTWTVNFKDSDIQEVIKFVADVTGRTVVIDPRVKGRVKVISSKPVNEAELIELFRTVLQMHDYSVVEVDNVLRIIPLKDARSSPVPVVDGKVRGEGFVTQVIQLQNIAAAKVLPSIRPLVPQHSHLSAYDPSNAIIITDTAENIARIRDLIDRLDKSATPVTEVVELKYANASEMVQVFTSLDPQDKSQSPQNTLNLTADKRNNAILVTGEDVQRQRVKDLIAKLDKPRSAAGNVRVVYLDYADAKTVAETLTKVMANLSKLGPGGKGGEGGGGPTASTVEADEDTNSLLITSSGDELETLLQVVEQLDIRRAQVLVEAIIVEVTDNDGENLGIEWLFRNTEKGVFGSSSNPNSRTASVGAAAFPGFADPSSDQALGALAGALTGAAGQMLGVIGRNSDNDFLALLNALESESKTNILSTPTLLTMDNHEASFTHGQNIPILTGSATTTGGTLSPFQTFQREDVGIKLTLTPQINEGNTILLDIAQESSSISQDASAAQGIITNKRTIQTKILAADGEIVVLGGLIEDDTNMTEQRIPVLGRIPLLGRLFRHESETKRRTNLMVFLKASIIRNDKILAGATAEKYQYIRDQQIRQRDGGFLRLDNKDLSVLPDMTFHNLQPPALDENVIRTPGAEARSEGATEQ